MVGWHHPLKRHESEQNQGDGEGQGSLACCSPWSLRKSDTTEQPNNHKKLPEEEGSIPDRDWGQEEKGTTEDEMAGWHH